MLDYQRLAEPGNTRGIPMHTMWFPSPDMMRDNDSAIITTIMIYTDADEASLATLRYVIHVHQSSCSS